MNIEAIIFDFNGTLFFDSDKHEKAWRIFLKDLCKREVPASEFINFVNGRINKDILEHFLEKQLNKKEVKELSNQKEKIYRKLCMEDKENFKLVDGLVELLEYLNFKHIPITIATSAGKDNLEFYINHFNLKKWFDLDKIAYDDGTILGKPNPDIYLRAIENINIAAEKCLVVEDALSGIESAKKAGIKNIIAIASQEDEHVFKNRDDILNVIRNYYDFKKFL